MSTEFPVDFKKHSIFRSKTTKRTTHRQIENERSNNICASLNDKTSICTVVFSCLFFVILHFSAHHVNNKIGLRMRARDITREKNKKMKKMRERHLNSHTDRDGEKERDTAKDWKTANNSH